MNDPVVLIGILKDRRDLNLLIRRRWYRIPVASCPTRRFEYLAFYQPAGFGRHGKRIRYYAAVRGCRMVQRRELLPMEPRHARAGAEYYRFHVGKVQELPSPVLNTSPRRVTFGFTTLSRLLKAKDILGLFDIPPLEQIMYAALKRAQINFSPEHIVSDRKRRKYRLDFAILCRRGRIDIECDGEKWHSSRAQKRRDRLRDHGLGQRGWVIVRLKEREILGNLGGGVKRVKRLIHFLGGC